MSLINKSIVIIIALISGFLIIGSLVMPFFRNTYEYGFGSDPYSAGRGGTSLVNPNCQTPSGSVIACTDCNITAGYSTFLTSCASLIATTNGSYCNGCSTISGYKTTYTGLLLLIFFIGLITVALGFLPRFQQ